MMKTVSVALVSAGAVVAASYLTLAAGQDKTASAGKILYVSSEKAAYTEMMPGVSRAVIWGDPDKAANAVFTKFKPGYDAGMHTHTSDVSLLVLKGAYLYRDEAGEKRVGPGEFLRVPGGHKHWSGGDKNETTVFYTESSGKFDLVPAK